MARQSSPSAAGHMVLQGAHQFMLLISQYAEAGLDFNGLAYAELERMVEQEELNVDVDAFKRSTFKTATTTALCTAKKWAKKNPDFEEYVRTANAWLKKVNEYNQITGANIDLKAYAGALGFEFS